MRKFLIILVTAVMLSLCTNAAFEKLNTYNDNFSDVSETSWYEKDVKTAFELGFMNGKGNGKFDPANDNGIFRIDYIRFIKRHPFESASHEELINNGYTATRLLQDEGFERGFYFAKYDHSHEFLEHGSYTEYCETDENPLWGIAPWWTYYDLYENLDKNTDKYTIKDDKDVTTVIYNPQGKECLWKRISTLDSLSMTEKAVLDTISIFIS